MDKETLETVKGNELRSLKIYSNGKLEVILKGVQNLIRKVA